jgi:hypothetical protein
MGSKRQVFMFFFGPSDAELGLHLKTLTLNVLRGVKKQTKDKYSFAVLFCLFFKEKKG